MQICAPLTSSQCKVSETRVTFKACGPLVRKLIAKCVLYEASFIYIYIFIPPANKVLEGILVSACPSVYLPVSLSVHLSRL